jgi:hypothetical protein
VEEAGEHRASLALRVLPTVATELRTTFTQVLAPTTLVVVQDEVHLLGLVVLVAAVARKARERTVWVAEAVVDKITPTLALAVLES